MKLYKLTDQDCKTRSRMLWGENVTHFIEPSNNPQLCTKGLIHAYQNLNLAYLLNPIHANYNNPIAWLAEGEIVVKDWGKIGTFKLTTIRQVKPSWVGSPKEQDVRIMFAIKCAKAVLPIFETAVPGNNAPRKAIEAALNRYHHKGSAIAKTGNAAIRAGNAAIRAGNAANAALHASSAAAYTAYAAAKASNAAIRAACAAYIASDVAYAAGHAANAIDTINFAALANDAIDKSFKKHNRLVKAQKEDK